MGSLNNSKQQLSTPNLLVISKKVKAKTSVFIIIFSIFKIPY